MTIEENFTNKFLRSPLGKYYKVKSDRKYWIFLSEIENEKNIECLKRDEIYNNWEFVNEEISVFEKNNHI